jgi:hypothetical protein
MAVTDPVQDREIAGEVFQSARQWRHSYLLRRDGTLTGLKKTRLVAVTRSKTSAASSEQADRKRTRLLMQARRRLDERAARAPRRRGRGGR